MSPLHRNAALAVCLILTSAILPGCDSAAPPEAVATAPPEAHISAPAAEAVVFGTVEVAYRAVAEGGLARVELLADGQPVGTSTLAEGTFSFDSAIRPDGPCLLTVRAVDRAGTTGTSEPVRVTILNTDAGPPTIRILAPEVSAVLRGAVRVRYEAEDDTGVARIDAFLNGSLAASDPAVTGEIQVPTEGFADGPYTLTLRAVDRVGNVGLSEPVPVILRNDAQSVRVMRMELLEAPPGNQGFLPWYGVELRTRGGQLVLRTPRELRGLPIEWPLWPGHALPLGEDLRALAVDLFPSTPETLAATEFYSPRDDLRSRPSTVTLTGRAVRVRLHLLWE